MGILYSTPKIDQESKMIYGCYPDIPDDRDHKKVYAIHPSIKNGTIKVIDIRDHCSPVFNQGKLGSCTANAVCANYEYIFMKKHGLIKSQSEIFSRLFVYWNERELENSTDKDSGASIRDGIRSIHTHGVPLEKYWPYDIAKFADKPDDQAFIAAFNHVNIKYARLDKNLDQLKQCLAEGNPFVFGFAVYESFESDDIAETGIMSVPTQNEKLLGGHAVMAVGVDENTKCFIIQNSWGDKWGDDGFFYMPYVVMFGSPKQNPEITSYTTDFWCIEANDDQTDVMKPLVSDILCTHIANV